LNIIDRQSLVKEHHKMETILWPEYKKRIWPFFCWYC